MSSYLQTEDAQIKFILRGGVRSSLEADRQQTIAKELKEGPQELLRNAPLSCMRPAVVNALAPPWSTHDAGWKRSAEV